MLTADGGVIALTFLDPDWVIPEGWSGERSSGITTLEWGIGRANPSTESVNALLSRAIAARRANQLTWATLFGLDDLRLDPRG